MNPARSASLCVTEWMNERRDTRFLFTNVTVTEARVTLAVISASAVSMRT